MTLISSQRYLDQDIVESKRVARDYTVSVLDVTVDGIDYQVVVDGHHSIAAAKADGVEPVIVVQNATQDDRAALNGEDLLEACYIDSDWYDLASGQTIWQ
jgi:hypothetical protein